MDQKQLDIIKSKIIDRDDLYIVLEASCKLFEWDFKSYIKFAEYCTDCLYNRLLTK